MNCDLSFAPAPSLVVAKPGEAASVRFSRCAPYTLSGGLARFLPCLRLISSPLNLLPMFPNDCYPCPRPKQRSETATLGKLAVAAEQSPQRATPCCDLLKTEHRKLKTRRFAPNAITEL